MVQSPLMLRDIHPRLRQAEPLERCCLDECKAACCLYGVWVDVGQAAELTAAAEIIGPHMPAGWDDPQTWFTGMPDEDSFTPSGQVIHTRVVHDPDHYGGSACVFLRGDHKCALQVAAQSSGLHPWHYKPFYCVLHPLDLDEQGRISLDENQALLAERGSCLRPARRPVPLAQTFSAELRYLLGDEVFAQMFPREVDDRSAIPGRLQPRRRNAVECLLRSQQ